MSILRSVGIDRESYFENGLAARRTYSWDKNHNKAVWHTHDGRDLGENYYVRKCCSPSPKGWQPDYLVYIGKYIISLCDMEHLTNIERYWNMELHQEAAEQLEKYLKTNILFYKGHYHYIGWRFIEKNAVGYIGV